MTDELSNIIDKYGNDSGPFTYVFYRYGARGQRVHNTLSHVLRDAKGDCDFDMAYSHSVLDKDGRTIIEHDEFYRLLNEMEDLV